jgi:hypothetical protein
VTQRSGLAEGYTVTSNYPSSRLDLQIRIYYCTVSQNVSNLFFRYYGNLKEVAVQRLSTYGIISETLTATNVFLRAFWKKEKHAAKLLQYNMQTG